MLDIDAGCAASLGTGTSIQEDTGEDRCPKQIYMSSCVFTKQQAGSLLYLGHQRRQFTPMNRKRIWKWSRAAQSTQDKASCKYHADFSSTAKRTPGYAGFLVLLKTVVLSAQSRTSGNWLRHFYCFFLLFDCHRPTCMDHSHRIWQS